jgi:hypothetical protein
MKVRNNQALAISIVKLCANIMIHSGMIFGLTTMDLRKNQPV